MPTPTEDKFILHWRALDCGPVCTLDQLSTYKRGTGFKLRTFDSFEDARLVESIPVGRGNEYALTSRGEDLLATADAIGYDPSAKPEPAPKTKPCPDCAGVGRKLLGIARQGADPEHVCELDYTCTTCKGRREVPGVQAPRLRNAINAMFQGQGRVTVAVDPVGGVSIRPVPDSVGAPDVLADFREVLAPLEDLPRYLTYDKKGRVCLAFGKHRGRRLHKVPSAYLNWASTQSSFCCKRTAEICADELLRREATTK